MSLPWDGSGELSESTVLVHTFMGHCESLILTHPKITPLQQASRQSISNSEARAAKRAAQAERRKQEVERKRQEREEQLKKEKEEAEMREKIAREFEEEKRKREEERR